MKEKELVSFVSFAVQFCKVCAVYINKEFKVLTCMTKKVVHHFVILQTDVV